MYCYEGSSVSFHPVDKAFDPKFSVSKFKSKKAIVNKLSLLNLFLKLELHQLVKNGYRNIQKTVIEKYKDHKKNVVIFYDGDEIASYRPIHEKHIKDTP